jgi:hypothetical protein
MDIICIDDKFAPEILEFYRIHGVVTPKKDSIYTIRDKIRHFTGDVGLLLDQIVNPPVPVQTPFGVMNREVTWNIKRFTTLNGSKISEEIEKHIINEITINNN